MDTILIKAAQLILALAILVVIHEFGHFLFARLFGMKVDKFYIFFNPVTSLFRWKPRRHISAFSNYKFSTPQAEADFKADKEFKAAADRFYDIRTALQQASNPGFFRRIAESLAPAMRKEREQSIPELQQKYAKEKQSYDAAYALMVERVNREYAEECKSSRRRRFWGFTEYGVGWLPLGGYCKISGMIDESMDTEQMKRDPQPWEFRSKPAWQRLLVMIAGVLFNFLLAILIYAGIVYATGEKYVPFKEAKMGMAWSGEAKKIGFRDGDIPLMADGRELENPFEDRIDMVQAKCVTVLRDNDTVNISIPEKFIFKLDEEAKSDTATISFFTYRFPARVTQVAPGEGAAKAGIIEGDDIIAVDSLSTPTLPDFLTALQGHENKTVGITIARKQGEKTDTITKHVSLSEYSKMGIGLEVDPSAFFNFKEKRYSLLASIPRGVTMGTDRLVNYAKSMKMVATREGAKSIGGFGTLGSIFPEKWNWIAFWNVAAFLSVALAFMNILPIPALDGGHVLFLMYEIIFRRKPSQTFMEYAQMAGMLFLIALLLYANGMDIVRLFK